MAEGELYVERRKHKRVEKKFRVNYKLIMGEDEVSEIRKNVSKVEGESSDISMGGLRITGEMPGNSGDIIRLEVYVEGRETPITTFAEIKWTKPGEDETKLFGLEFLILKDADKETINELIGND